MSTVLYSQETYSEQGLFYFNFERQFIDAGLRCIPMCVRYKLDTVNIKLSLEVWCKMNKEERITLATAPCYSDVEIKKYDEMLTALISQYSEHAPLRLITSTTSKDEDEKIYHRVADRCTEYFIQLKWNDWMSLTELERFALSKLLKPGHESKNFVPALKEFGLLNQWTLQGNE